MKALTSRERLLAAIACQEPDRVPLYFNVYGVRPPAHLAWSNDLERVERLLSLGADATLTVNVPPAMHPDVRVRAWEEVVPGERYPVMVKEYETPAGTLRQEVFRTEDWYSPDWPSHVGRKPEVELIDDHNVPRSRRFPIQTEADVEALRYLLWPASGEQIRQFRADVEARAEQARRLGVLVDAYAPRGGGADMAAWLCGVEGMVLMAVDRPAVFARLQEVVHEYDKRNVEILLDTPVELITRRGWYEGAAFWSPALYRRFFLPQLRELTQMTHQAGRRMGYIMTTGFMPILDQLAEVGYDLHYYIDPVMGGPGVDLRKVKQAFGKRTAILGGMNSPVTLERGTRGEIRQAVFEAVRALAPGGGFILSPVDCLAASTPWQSVETLIEAWKEVRDYPIA